MPDSHHRMSKGNVPAMTEFTITDATEADIPDVLAIARASFPDPWSEQNYRSALAYSVFSIARLEGKTVGFCVVNVSADERVLSENGKIDVKKLRPITYDSSNHKYLVLGDAVGNAFSDGKAIKNAK